jgi:aryl carrier-like protein
MQSFAGVARFLFVVSPRHGYPYPVLAIGQEVPVTLCNPVEASMVPVWADLLGAAEPPGVHDNLFRLGAGSLAVVRFVAWVAEAYGVSLGVHHIVEAPTITEIAELVSAAVDCGQVPEPAAEDGLAGLADEELDGLLGALQAARDRRRAARGPRPGADRPGT